MTSGLHAAADPPVTCVLAASMPSDSPDTSWRATMWLAARLRTGESERAMRSSRRWRRGALACIAALWAVHLAYGIFCWIHPLPADLALLGEESSVITTEAGEWMHIGLTADERRQLPVAQEDDLHVFYAALLAQEDRRFFDHAGVDVRGLMRATITTVFGERQEGASTITMQLARMIDATPRTVMGKMQQVFRARQIEARHSKQDILHAYAARVPFGGNLHGVASVAYAWFGKRAEDLDAAEAALLVSVLPAPTRYSPKNDPAGALQRRNRVLDAMAAMGALSHDVYTRSIREPLGLDPLAFPDLGAHAWQRVADGSTTIDGDMQRGVERLAKESQGVDGVSIVVVENRDVLIRALVGSKHSSVTEMDATRSPRSAGSTLKPFLFGLAYERGLMTPDTILWDTPWARADWQPKNFDRREHGPVRAHEALWASYNLPAVRLAESMPRGAFVECLRRFGFRHTRDVHDAARVDLSLGTDDVTAMELTGGYAALARGGSYMEPSLRARDGNARAKRVMNEGAARLVLASLADAHRARPNGAPVRDIAWKTGTSSARRDAWAVGMTADYTVVVWRGRLSGIGDSSLVGTRTAVPLLFDVLALVDPTPEPLDTSAGTRSTWVCARSGLRATEACANRVRSTRPAEGAGLRPCTVHRRIWVDADSGCERCAACKAGYNVEQRNVALLSPTQLRWWKRLGRAPERYPLHAKDCAQAPHEPLLQPEFLFPVDRQTLLADGALCTVRVHVVGPDLEEPLRLVVNARDCGETENDGRKTLTLPIGRHEITAVTSRRTERTIVITIEAAGAAPR